MDLSTEDDSRNLLILLKLQSMSTSLPRNFNCKDEELHVLITNYTNLHELHERFDD